MSKASVSIVFGTGTLFGVLATLVCQRITWKLVQAEYFYFVCIVLWGIAMIFLACSISSWNERRWFKQTTSTSTTTDQQARSGLWWLLPLFLVFVLMLSWEPLIVSTSATSTEKVQPGCTSAVTRHPPKKLISTSVPMPPTVSKAKPVDDDAKAARRQRMWSQLQTIVAEGVRKGEGCIAFTKRLASTEAGQYLDLEPLDLNECVALAMANRVPALHYRHSDGSTTVLAPELAVGKTSGWHIGVDTTINGVPTFVLTRQWSIRGMP